MVSETRYGALEIVGSTTTTTTIIVGSITIHKLVQAKIITHTIGLHRPCMHYNKYYRGNIYKTSALARHKPLYGGVHSPGGLPPCHLPFSRYSRSNGQNLGPKGKNKICPGPTCMHHAKFHADRCHRRRDICNWTIALLSQTGCAMLRVCQ